MADTTAPRLISLQIPTLIDLSKGKSEFSFTTKATDDFSGVKAVYLWLDQPLSYAYGPTSTSMTIRSDLIGQYAHTDSWDDGTSSETRYILPWNNNGTYNIIKLSIEDNQGNKIDYSAAQLSALGANTSFSLVGATPDTSAPLLTSLSLPTTIDLSAGMAPLQVAAGAADAQSGIEKVLVWFDRPLAFTYSMTPPSTASNGSLFGLYGLSDSWSDGSSTSTYGILPSNQPGTYNVSKVTVTDMQGNSRDYYTSELKALGINTAINLVGTQADTVAPALTGLTIPGTVDLSTGNTPFRISSTATDNQSGIREVTVWLDKPLSYSLSPVLGSTTSTGNLFGMYGTTDLWGDGASSDTYYLLSSNQNGIYHVTSVTVTDKQGNNLSYSAAELSALGINTTISVSGSPSAPTRGLTLNGTAGTDLLYGDANADILNGFEGDDYLMGGAGDDTLNGGAGIDLASFSDVLSGYKLSYQGNGVYILQDIDLTNHFDDGTDTLIGIESLKFGGDRILRLPDGAAYNYAGAFASNELAIQHYVDSVNRNLLPATFSAGWYLAKNPDLRAWLGTNEDAATWHYLAHGRLEGRSVDRNGDDVLTGSAQKDYLDGGEGNDTLIGKGGNDILVGGGGTDTVVFSGAASDYHLEYWNDFLSVLHVLNKANGDDGLDSIVSVEVLQFADRSFKLPDPVRYNFAGAFARNEDALTHYVNFAINLHGLDAQFDPGWYLAKYADLRAWLGNNEDAATWHYLAHGFAEGRLVDPNGNDVLGGSPLVDLIRGYGGNDTLGGGGGNDTLDGGSGADTAVYQGLSSSYRFGVQNGAVTVQDIDLADGNEGTDTLTGIETLQFADRSIVLPNAAAYNYVGAFANADEALRHFLEVGIGQGRLGAQFDAGWYLAKNPDLRAWLGNNLGAATWHYLAHGWLEGRPADPNGDDVLGGSAQADALKGYGGNDVLAGRQGNDSIDGGGGTDTAQYQGASTGYRLGLQNGVITVQDIDLADGDEGTDSLTGIEKLQFADRSFTLPDAAAYNYAGAFANADEALRHYLELGINQGQLGAQFDAGWYLAKNPDLRAWLGNNLDAAAWHYLAHGRLEGRSIDAGGSDVLAGSPQADVLDGYGGNDILTGGGGADVFVFSTQLGSGNIDTITDFTPGVDKIRLAGGAFPALTGQAGMFRLDGSATDAAVRIIYQPDTGALLYDADGSGAAAPVQFAILPAHLTLTAADFLY